LTKTLLTGIETHGTRGFWG